MSDQSRRVNAVGGLGGEQSWNSLCRLLSGAPVRPRAHIAFALLNLHARLSNRVITSIPRSF